VPSGPPDTSEGTESRDGGPSAGEAESRSPAGIAVGGTGARARESRSPMTFGTVGLAGALRTMMATHERGE